jgi:hypothetical protein
VNDWLTPAVSFWETTVGNGLRIQAVGSGVAVACWSYFFK